MNSPAEWYELDRNRKMEEKMAGENNGLNGAGFQGAGFHGSRDYVASEELMASVNVAIALKKPLLIKGEPGTGKTKLAEAVAASLGKKLIIWNINDQSPGGVIRL